MGNRDTKCIPIASLSRHAIRSKYSPSGWRGVWNKGTSFQGVGGKGGTCYGRCVRGY